MVVSIKVYPDFDNLNATNNRVYDNLSGTSRGLHAITLVGFNDTERTFKFINSWGTSFGDGGYGWLSYDIFTSNNGCNNWGYVMIDNTVKNVPDEIVTGDFDGDGTLEFAGFYGHQNYMKLVVWDDVTPGTYDRNNGTVVAVSDAYNISNIAGRIVAGDFDGDGKDEIGVLYNHGTFIRFWIFSRNENGTFTGKYVLTTGAFNAETLTGRVAAGDFDGDGRDEIGALQEYGDSVRFWIFNKPHSNETDHYYVGTTGIFDANNFTNRVAAGDFDGDGRDELGALYEANNTVGFWIFNQPRAGETDHYKAGTTEAFSVSAISNRVTAGDFDNDTRDELSAFFNYGYYFKIWKFKKTISNNFEYGIIG